MIGGTSTGGILALAVGLMKMSAKECVELYTNLAAEVFANKKQMNLLYDGTMYTATPLEHLLEKYFKQEKLIPNEKVPKVTISDFHMRFAFQSFYSLFLRFFSLQEEIMNLVLISFAIII